MFIEQLRLFLQFYQKLFPLLECLQRRLYRSHSCITLMKLLEIGRKAALGHLRVKPNLRLLLLLGLDYSKDLSYTSSKLRRDLL